MKRNIRCVEGRLMCHDLQPDLETDVGECPECEGTGHNCADCGAPHAEEAWEDYAPYRSGYRLAWQHFCTDCADHRRDPWFEAHS